MDCFFFLIYLTQTSFIDGGVNLKVRGLTGTWGAVGIEMSKFEAKKGDFANIWQKLEGYSTPSPRLRRPCP